MEITISEALKKANPNLSLGVVETTVVVEKHSSGLWKEIDKQIASTGKSHSIEVIAQLPEIAAVRETYRRLGKDPVRYRGSAEALIRRILQGKGLYKVNNVVDINNLVSIETLHPVGSYDLGNISGPIIFTIGEQGESYKGIGKEAINIAELPVFKDAKGPYGSPTSDSERAMITSITKRIIMVIISFTGTGLKEGAERAAELLEKYAQAESCDVTIVS
ncbi:MAG: phenylalanine--tRNA ligase beta subunit-related protein [Patescibacteria group bacterium]